MDTRSKPALPAPPDMRTHGGLPPYGFRRREDGKRSRRGSVVDLEPVASEQQIIARVQELHAEGLSLRKIADALSTEGLSPRCGSRWHAMMIKRLVDRGVAQNSESQVAPAAQLDPTTEAQPVANANGNSLPFRRVASVFSDEQTDDDTEVYWNRSTTRDIVDRYTPASLLPNVPDWF